MASMAQDPFNHQIVLNEALRTISLETLAQPDLGSLFERVALLLKPVLSFDQVVFSVYDLQRRTAVLSIVGDDGLSSVAVPLDTEYQQWSSSPQIVDQSDLPDTLKSWLEGGIQSYCSAPLNTTHRSVGAIGFGSTQRDEYTPADLECLRYVAVQIAFAVSEDLYSRRLAVPEPNRKTELNQKSPDYATGMLDAEGRVLTWNTSVERPSGYRSEEIVGNHMSLFYTSADLEQHRDREELRIAAEQGTYETEHWFVRRDGTQFWANVLFTTLRIKQGQVWRFLVTARNLSQRKLAEEALLVGMADILGSSGSVANL